MSNISKKFGNRLRRIRKQNDLSQEELAAKSDLHRTYISDIEQGSRNVSLVNLEKLANALDISLPNLLKLDK